MSDQPPLPDQIGAYRNRIIGLRVVPVRELLDNPDNWRQHPQVQLDALDSVMSRVGVVDVLRHNVHTGHLIDGHARKRLYSADPEAQVVVLDLDLTPEEERIILATFDPLAGLAGTDMALLDELLESVGLDDLLGEEAVGALFPDLENQPEAYDMLDHVPDLGLPAADEEESAENAGSEPSQGPARREDRPRFPLAVVLTTEQRRRWEMFKEEAGLSRDTAAFLRLLEEAGY